MHPNASNGVVLLSLSLVLMASFPKSNGFFNIPSVTSNSGGINPFSNFIDRGGAGNSSTGRGGSGFPSNNLQVAENSVVLERPDFFLRPPRRSYNCPDRSISCPDFIPPCTGIRGCSVCFPRDASGRGFCPQCFPCYARRPDGRACIPCSKVANCATCTVIGDGTVKPFVRCTACCPGFILDSATGTCVP